MTASETKRALTKAARLANDYIEALPDRHVGARVDAEEVIDEMVRAIDPGLVASAGPRYFGFVVGGALPASVAADRTVDAIVRCAHA